jgi:hypothetical protein
MLPIHSRFNARLGAALVAFALAGCASHPAVVPSAQWPAQLESALPTDVLLLGEQHDAPDHQRLQRDTVQWLAARGRLAAVVLEMAERGHSTAALARGATEAQVQSALQWNDAAWPWSAYGPVTMAAVRAGVPVLGGNLPRSAMAAATQETRWANHLAVTARQQLLDALQDGMGLLPATTARHSACRSPATPAWPSQPRAVRRARPCCWWWWRKMLRHRGIPTHWPQNIRSKSGFSLYRASASSKNR